MSHTTHQNLDENDINSMAIADLKAYASKLQREKIGHCKDCVHYATNDADARKDYFANYPVPPTCINPNNIIGYGYGDKDLPVDGVHLEDDEGWAWRVGPEFGCVKFEKA